VKRAYGCLVVPPPSSRGASPNLRVRTPDGDFCLDREHSLRLSPGDVVDVEYHPEDQFAQVIA
jgi:hypothetical protein